MVKVDHLLAFKKKNNIKMPLKEYKMTVYVFGNHASPAVATYESIVALNAGLGS